MARAMLTRSRPYFAGDSFPTIRRDVRQIGCVCNGDRLGKRGGPVYVNFLHGTILMTHENIRFRLVVRSLCVS